MKFAKIINFIMVGVISFYIVLSGITLVWIEYGDYDEYSQPPLLSVFLVLWIIFGLAILALGVTGLVASVLLPEKSKGKVLSIIASALAISGFIIGWVPILSTAYHVAMLVLYIVAGIQVGKKSTKHLAEDYVSLAYAAPSSQSPTMVQKETVAKGNPGQPVSVAPTMAAGVAPQPTGAPPVSAAQPVPVAPTKAVGVVPQPMDAPPVSAAQPVSVAPTLAAGVAPQPMDTPPVSAAQPVSVAPTLAAGVAPQSMDTPPASEVQSDVVETIPSMQAVSLDPTVPTIGVKLESVLNNADDSKKEDQ